MAGVPAPRFRNGVILHWVDATDGITYSTEFSSYGEATAYARQFNVTSPKYEADGYPVRLAELPRKWPFFEPGWYLELSWATFGPDTESSIRSLWRRHCRSCALMFFVPEPTRDEVLQFANGIGAL